MKATLVSFYRKKPENLLSFLELCQDMVSEILDSRFRKYELGQIHATIVGLERDETHGNLFYNRNFKKHCECEIPMDFDGFLQFLRTSGHLPFQVQIGGFQDRDYPFVSRNTRPYRRSFSLQGKNVVVMGWPLRGEPIVDPSPSYTELIQEGRIYPDTLDVIRRAAQGYGILHAYHGRPTDVDNDFFFR